MNTIEEINAKLIESTIEIFTEMVMMEVSVLDESLKTMGSLTHSITGTVGLGGTHKGVLAIHFPKQVALAVTSSFLGMEVEEVNEDVQDAIGEVANMLGGTLKTILSDRGKDIHLSLPSTIHGDKYAFSSQIEGDLTILSFEAPTGSFHVEVRMER